MSMVLSSHWGRAVAGLVGGGDGDLERSIFAARGEWMMRPSSGPPRSIRLVNALVWECRGEKGCEAGHSELASESGVKCLRAC